MSEIGVFSLDKDNNVVFSLSNMGRSIDGPELALQATAKALLTEPGSSAWAPGDGGGCRELLAKGVQGQATTKTDIAVILRRAMETIRRSQSKSSRPANATVASLDLIDVSTDTTAGKIRARVRINLVSGNSFAANFNIGNANA